MCHCVHLCLTSHQQLMSYGDETTAYSLSRGSKSDYKVSGISTTPQRHAIAIVFSSRYHSVFMALLTKCSPPEDIWYFFVKIFEI